jgi:Flp pilus assembly protein CpaB
MKNRWQKASSRRPEEPGARPAPLAAELEPVVRLRSGANGAAARRRRRWLQPLPLAGGLLILLAFVGYLSVYNQTTKRTTVLVASRTLPAGSVLREGDLRTASIGGDTQLLAALVPSRSEPLVLGRTLKTAIVAGAPLPAGALSSPGRQRSSFTLAVPVLHALAGDLSAGDRVTVLATFTSPGGRTTTRPVARDLEVLAVGRASGFDASAQTIPVTVALADPALASALALANEAGKLDLLREGGSGRTAPIPPATVSGTGP